MYKRQIELSPASILDSESDSCHVGDFFDSADRAFLRLNESNESELIPSIVLESSDEEIRLGQDLISLEENGSPSISYLASSDEEIRRGHDLLALEDIGSTSASYFNNTSTPLRSADGHSVLIPPDLSPIGLSDLSEENSFEYFASVRRRPRRVVYSDSSADMLRPDLPDRWEDRPIKCFKYVDDCLSVEKVFMKGAEKFNVDGQITALSIAPKTQAHFRTVEYNLSLIHI